MANPVYNSESVSPELLTATIVQMATRKLLRHVTSQPSRGRPHDSGLWVQDESCSTGLLSLEHVWHEADRNIVHLTVEQVHKLHHAHCTISCFGCVNL